MKKIITLIISVVLFVSFTIPSQAAEITKEDYLADYSEYKTYYNDVYVPSYLSYNQTLSDFAAEISNTEFTSEEQALRVINFLKDLKNRRNDFFGNRNTVGKSRYVVPTLRNSMYAAASTEDFASAYNYCNDLCKAVEARVAFLNGLSEEINNFEILQPVEEEINASVAFTVTKQKKWWYDYKLVITNNSDKPLKDWNLKLSVDGDITHAVLSGGGYNDFGRFTYAGGYYNFFSLYSSVFELYPFDEWQGGYVIPAGGSITFLGGGESIRGITGATINGVQTDVSFQINNKK